MSLVSRKVFSLIAVLIAMLVASSSVISAIVTFIFFVFGLLLGLLAMQLFSARFRVVVLLFVSIISPIILSICLAKGANLTLFKGDAAFFLAGKITRIGLMDITLRYAVWVAFFLLIDLAVKILYQRKQN